MSLKTFTGEKYVGAYIFINESLTYCDKKNFCKKHIQRQKIYYLAMIFFISKEIYSNEICFVAKCIFSNEYFCHQIYIGITFYCIRIKIIAEEHYGDENKFVMKTIWRVKEYVVATK